MMTVAKYAAKVGVPASTIRQLCAECKLPSVKIGVPYYIYEDEADQYFYNQWLARKAEAEEKEARATKRRPPAKPTATKKEKAAANFLERLKAFRQGEESGLGGAEA